MPTGSPIACVTGAAKRLGRAAALGLGAAGHDLVVHYGRSETEARRTADDIRSLGRRALLVQADLADPREIEAMMERVRAEFGRLDLLVNSAATFHPMPLSQLDVANWEEVMSVNLRAPALCIRFARPLLEAGAVAREGTSSIVNIVDLAGVLPWRGYAVHGASKAALIQLTRSAALELAPRIRANAVMPGAILPPPGVSEEGSEWLEVGRRLPLGRSGRSEDVVRAILFLAGAEFVTGQILGVDGGEQLLGNMKR